LIIGLDNFARLIGRLRRLLELKTKLLPAYKSYGLEQQRVLERVVGIAVVDAGLLQCAHVKLVIDKRNENVTKRLVLELVLLYKIVQTDHCCFFAAIYMFS